MKQYNYGIDLLKICAMLGIVTLHVIGHGGLFAECVPLSAKHVIIFFLEVMVFCSVNCYALITGYVMCEKSASFGRLVEIWMQVFFYSMGILLIAVFSSWRIGKEEVIASVLPITGGGTGIYHHILECIYYFLYCNYL